MHNLRREWRFASECVQLPAIRLTTLTQCNYRERHKVRPPIYKQHAPLVLIERVELMESEDEFVVTSTPCQNEFRHAPADVSELEVDDPCQPISTPQEVLVDEVTMDENGSRRLPVDPPGQRSRLVETTEQPLSVSHIVAARKDGGRLWAGEYVQVLE